LEEAIVRPPIRKKDRFPIPPWVVMAATGPDVARLRQKLALPSGNTAEPLYLSRIYPAAQDPPPYCLAGPFMGAPQAAMLMEVLSAWGGRHFLFVGWCGAIDPRMAIGDVLLPTSAIIDEGTSRGYDVTADRLCLPGNSLHDRVKALLSEQRQPCREGAVWTTDAIFRETPAKVQSFRRQGALAVEMEISACLTVAQRNGVEFAAVLVVSDELSDLTWRPGFRDPRFKQARRAVSQMIESLCQTL
jgi:purine-nucleoside phosphorylase